MTAAEVGNLGVPTSWVYEQSRRGRIPTVTLGRYRRYRVEAIERVARGAWKRTAVAGSGAAAKRQRKDSAASCGFVDRRLASTAGGFGKMEFMARRSRGTGSLSMRRDARGVASWYGQWWTGGRRVTRKLGRKRDPGSRAGLTRSQAERELQRQIDQHSAAPVSSGGHGVGGW